MTGHWEGYLSGSNPEETIYLDGSKAVTAVFENDAEPQQGPEPVILPDKILPPGCGAGMCGVGFIGAMPLTVQGWCYLKL